MRNPTLRCALLGCLGLSCCGDGGGGTAGTQALFDLRADLGQPERFFDFPYPSDLRLGPGGAPDLRGFPNPQGLAVIEAFRGIAGERPGFPVVPVGYFRFTAALAARDPEAVLPARADAPVLLLDVDPASSERGRLFPTVATVPPADNYAPENLLAVAPRPGEVLAGRRRYAFVLRRSLNDAAGQALGVPAALASLSAGQAPEGVDADRAQAATRLHAPLFETLRTLGVDRAEVAAATVFTTGDLVAELADLSTALLQKHAVSIADLKLDPVDNQRVCVLAGKVRYPQFQKGMPPFNKEGLFDLKDGLPAVQREEEAPVRVLLPRTPMPAAGYPLVVYFHGSGGLSTAVLDRGPVRVPGGPEQKGLGPGYVLAAFGIASAGSALPLNPERLPGAEDTAYLNFQNLPAFRDTFRQGVIEQRLFIAALRELHIGKELLAGCSGPALPPGATDFHFAPEQLIAMGQSMGGMYTNLISAVEPRVRAAVPTGAGGYWSYFILKTGLLKNAAGFVGVLLGTQEKLTFLHPALHLLQTGWEVADPLIYMPRLGRRPLPGNPARPVYQPVGQDDIYFPTPVYDAAALAYGHRQAGERVWPAMQEALKLDGLDGLLPYPVRQDLEDATPRTGVVVQYRPDGIADAHYIFAQLDAVKYQYGCFVATFLATGVAVVPAPAPLGTPCPQ